MTAAINMNCAPSPSMWSTFVPYVPPPSQNIPITGSDADAPLMGSDSDAEITGSD